MGSKISGILKKKRKKTTKTNGSPPISHPTRPFHESGLDIWEAKLLGAPPMFDGWSPGSYDNNT